MDIWRWVWDLEESLRARGQHRLATLIDKLPDYAVNSQHAKMDAVFPEALALARATGNPWVEIYVRHWHLQSKVLVRGDARGSIEEAVSLAEFAHRKEHLDCPQSVCVTQDLTTCYAFFDGPGYAVERLQVSQDTLARIDPSWPCFVCISCEYADALTDSGRHQEALRFIDEQARQARLENKAEAHRLLRRKFEPLLALGRFEEALVLAERSQEVADDANMRLESRLCRCLALCRLKRYQQAVELTPEWSEIEPTPSRYRDYSRVIESLALEGPLENDYLLDRPFRQMQQTLLAQGVHRGTFEMALRRARLAIARGRRQSAQACLEAAAALIGNLRQPLDAPGQLGELQDAWQALPQGASEEPPDADDPEALLDFYAGKPDQHRELATAWRRCGWYERAYEVVQDFDLRGSWLLFDGRYQELIDECRQDDADDPAQVLFFWGRALEAQEKLEEAAQRYLEVLNLMPEAINTRLRLAQVWRRLERFEEALELLDGLCREQPAGDWDWDLLVVATRLQDWPRVRACCLRLDMKLESQHGPVDENWGVIRIRIEGLDWAAQRTGPVSATIIQMTHESSPHSRYGDQVIFDATPLNQPSEGELLIFPGLYTVESAGYRVYAIDGVHPGEEALEAFREAADELRLSAAYNPEYRVGEGLQGFFGHLAVPPEVELNEAHRRLAELTAGWEHPWLWTGLVAELGLEEELARQNEVAEKYGITLG